MNDSDVWTNFSLTPNSLDPNLKIYIEYIQCLEERSSQFNISLPFYQWLYVISYFYNVTFLVPLDDSLQDNKVFLDRMIGLSRKSEIDYVMLECKTRHTVERPFLLGFWEQLMWTTVFGAMLATSIIGNIMVIWIIYGS